MEFDFRSTGGGRFILDGLAFPKELDLFGRAEPGALEFGVGIEEEYFLSDIHTMQVACETSDSLFELASACLPGRIDREFLQSQVETATTPHARLSAAGHELVRLRHTAAAAATEHGLAIMAAGTHPSATWASVAPTRKPRYGLVMDDLQMIGRRNMLCGMHVHVEFPDPERRVDVMTRMLPYVPLLLALSTSSPFWQGRNTGLKGYRLAAYDELPRTGLPELFRTNEEYEAYISALVRSGVMDDSSYVWWAIRPSAKYPTLELRAPDCCTRVQDALAIAALYRSLARHLYLDREHHSNLDPVGRALAVENKWRAQRYGVHGTFVTEPGAQSVAEVLEEAIELVQDDADALQCTAEVETCRAIIQRGTSADEQIRIYEEQLPQLGHDGAVKAVAEWIASASLEA
jgi:glutamate---cysteine ligase / carboxylate-amine ligase